MSLGALAKRSYRVKLNFTMTVAERKELPDGRIISVVALTGVCNFNYKSKVIRDAPLGEGDDEKKEELCMKIFTIESGDVREGVKVESFTLKECGDYHPCCPCRCEEGRKEGSLEYCQSSSPSRIPMWNRKKVAVIHISIFRRVGTTKAGKL